MTASLSPDFEPARRLLAKQGSRRIVPQYRAGLGAQGHHDFSECIRNATVDASTETNRALPYGAQRHRRIQALQWLPSRGGGQTPIRDFDHRQAGLILQRHIQSHVRRLGSADTQIASALTQACSGPYADSSPSA